MKKDATGDLKKWEAISKWQSDNPNGSVHCHIPMCVGFDSCPSAEGLDVLLSDLASKNYRYTLYLSPKDKDAEFINAWMSENPDFYNKYKSNIVSILDWRKSKLWQDAYQALSMVDEDKDLVKVVQSDVQVFKKRLARKVKKAVEKDQTESHAETRDEDVRQHVISDVADCLSWSDRLGVESGVKNVLLYEHSLSQLMYRIIDDKVGRAEDFGYVKGSLMRLKPNFEELQAQYVEKLRVNNFERSPVRIVRVSGLAPAAVEAAGFALAVAAMNRRYDCMRVLWEAIRAQEAADQREDASSPEGESPAAVSSSSSGSSAASSPPDKLNLGEVGFFKKKSGVIGNIPAPNLPERRRSLSVGGGISESG